MVKITFDVPKEMLAIAADPAIREHPYNLCFLCPAHTVTCDGPNELAMDIDRYVEWNNQLAKKKGFTRQTIAEESGLPHATVVSVLSKRTTDPRHSTTQAISKATSGGCWGKYPCHLAALLMNGEAQILDEDDDSESLKVQLNRALGRIEEMNKMVEDMHISYKAEMDAIRAKAEKIADYLKQEIAKRDETIATKDKIIAKMVLGE